MPGDRFGPGGRIMLSIRHTIKWLLSLCGSSDGGWGNPADVQVNMYVASGLKPIMYHYQYHKIFDGKD